MTRSRLTFAGGASKGKNGPNPDIGRVAVQAISRLNVPVLRAILPFPVFRLDCLREISRFAELEMARRLAAVMAVDIVGYSRMVEADEAGSLAVVKQLLKTIVEPKVRQYHGRVVKLMGDGMLVEFSSAVDAVTCAVEIQLSMADRNAGVPAEIHISYRIGINVGDVVVDGDDIFGDGVIIAARLESLCEPDGVYISENALNQIKGKLDLDFDPVGERRLKNVSNPVAVFRVVLDEKATGLKTGMAVTPMHAAWYRDYRAAIAAVLVLIIFIGAWWLTQSRPLTVSIRSESVRETTVLAENKPTLAVMPFANISDDKEQEYFSDGMTEDLATDLSKLANLRVISSTITARYKGQAIDVREVGETLNVRYLVEGSVRKAGGQVRINTQLTDTATGRHLWAERYVGDLEDIFDLQDQVLEKIVDTLSLQLSVEEKKRLSARGTLSVAAHDLYLKGLYLESNFSRESYEKAVALYNQALSIDPNYAQPYMQIANILELGARSGWSDDIQGDLRKAVKLAGKAVELDPRNPQTHWSYGRAVARLNGDDMALQKGIAALQKAIELNPDFADAYAYLAVLYTGAGRAEDGLRSVETAMQLNPNYPFWYLFMRGMVRFALEEYELAISDFLKAVERSPTAQFLRWWLAAAYAKTDQMDEAEWQVEELYMMGFDGSISTILETQPIRYEPYIKIYRAALAKAGLPEN